MASARITVPAGVWIGPYQFVDPDGTPPWRGQMNLTVAEDGEVTGTGDFDNEVITMVLEFAGRVRGDGNLHLQATASDGDRVSITSTESRVDADEWNFKFSMSKWQGREGSATLTRTP